MRRILYLLFGFIIACEVAHARVVAVRVDQIDKGSLVDLYGLPGSLELELVVELVFYKKSADEFMFSSPPTIAELAKKDLSFVLLKAPVPSVMDHPITLKFDVDKIKSKISKIKQQGFKGELYPYLRVSLAENSKNGLCLFSKCYYNFTTAEMERLTRAREVIIKKLASQKKGQYFLSYKEELEKYLSKDERLSVEQFISSQWVSNNVIPLQYILEDSQMDEPFWLESGQYSEFIYSLFGEVSIK